MAVYPEPLLRTIKPRDRRNVAADGALRQLRLILRYASVDLTAPLSERSVSDAVYDEEEKFIFRNGVAVVVLLLRTELLV